MIRHSIGPHLCAAIIAIGLFCASSYPSAVSVVVDPTTEGVVFDGYGGFGGMDVHWGSGPWFTDAFLDLVIDTLGFTLMRTVIEPMG